MKKRNALTASVLALLVAAPVLAQNTLTVVDDLDERIDTIQEDVTDDLNDADRRDRLNNQYAQGWTGGLALGLTATSGNTDTADLNVAGRLRYGNGPWNHTFGFALELAEDNDVRNKEQAYFTYDANRYFSEQFYVFGLASLRYDNFDSNKYDAFLGFGPGYRVLNEEGHTWRVQAGPGARYVEDQSGADSTELAGIVSSRYYIMFNENVFLTNDTDILFSDEDTFVTNDLGVNFRMTDTLSTRVSYRSEWDSNPLTSFDSSDNSLGVSLVYGF